MSYFVSGIACYYYNDFFKKYNLKLFVLGVLIFVFESYFDVEFLKPIALSIIIFTVAFNFKKLNTFAKYGDISYGIYIFHLPLIQVAVHFGLFKSVSTITSFSLIISSVLISGLLTWHLLEKKFLNKNRKVIKID
jgi:peptidoglycan/LPS O-acetylase OafA/YrhL